MSKIYWYQRAQARMKVVGISHAHLAKTINKTRGAVGHYLSGRREPGIAQLRLIAAALQVDSAWLAFGMGSLGNRDQLADDACYAADQKFVNVFSYNRANSIDAVVRKQIIFPREIARCYALEIADDAYAPVIRVGECILVDPIAPVVTGNQVLAIYHDDSFYIGALCAARKECYVVGHIKDRKHTFSLLKTDLKHLHCIRYIFRPLSSP